VQKQRPIAAAVVGAVVAGFGALTLTAPQFVRHASADEEPVKNSSPAPRGVGRLEAAPPRSLRPHTGTSAPATSVPSPAARLGPRRQITTLRSRPLVIGHRGAAGYRPEETLDSYRLAIAQGADYIEADLVPTGDGALVARHENELSATTDVAERPEFADRRRTKTINGVTATGWFTEDFTLAELRTLRAVSRGGQDGPTTATIPTLQEIIDLVRAQRRPIGLYLELKTPAYFTSLGLAPEERLADALRRNRLTGRNAQVYVESFDAPSLRTMRRLVDVPEIQLVGGADPADPAVQPAGLARIRQYAAGIGIDRARLGTGGLCSGGEAALDLVSRAHQDHLEVHVFTFAADPEITYRGCFQVGVDGVFTDNPDLAVKARRDTFPTAGPRKPR
jgi:glycerophosphoryl diester phosphodiesterase